MKLAETSRFWTVRDNQIRFEVKQTGLFGINWIAGEKSQKKWDYLWFSEVFLNLLKKRQESEKKSDDSGRSNCFVDSFD
jgi:hypothetical protein